MEKEIFPMVVQAVVDEGEGEHVCVFIKVVVWWETSAEEF